MLTMGTSSPPVFHPLLLFNDEGDCLAAKLRPGNVHSAEGWEELLLPELERQQQIGKEVAFRGDAPFASCRKCNGQRPTVLPVEGTIDLPFNIAGKPPAKGGTYNGDEQWRAISAHYFAAFKIPLLRGRVFNERDTGNSAGGDRERAFAKNTGSRKTPSPIAS